jgi:hypothetical protein
LIPIDNVIGGVDIEHDLLGGAGLGFYVGIHDQIFDLLPVGHNLLVTAFLIGILRR